MKFFGIEIHRIPPPEPDPVEAMKLACDAMNEAWEQAREQGMKTRPWVIWEESRMVLTQYNGERIIVHE